MSMRSKLIKTSVAIYVAFSCAATGVGSQMIVDKLQKDDPTVGVGGPWAKELVELKTATGLGLIFALPPLFIGRRRRPGAPAPK